MLKAMPTIYLIKEDDTRLTLFRFFKKQSKLPFGFSDPFAQTVCTLPHEEGYEKQVRQDHAQTHCAYIFSAQMWNNWLLKLGRVESFLYQVDHEIGRLVVE